MNGPDLPFSPGLQEHLTDQALARWPVDDLHCMVYVLRRACQQLPDTADDRQLLFLTALIARIEAQAFARRPADMAEFAMLVDLAISDDDALADMLQAALKQIAFTLLPTPNREVFRHAC